MIIHNGKDYWDGASYMGVDKTYHLVRSNDATAPSHTMDMKLPHFQGNNRKWYSTGVIYAMGKAYPFIFDIVNHAWRDDDGHLHWPNMKIAYDRQTAVDTWEDLLIDGERWTWDTANNMGWKKFVGLDIFTDKFAADFLLKNEATFSLVLPRSFHNPLGIMNYGENASHRESVWINPAFLSRFNFQTIIPPSEFYRMADDWLCGVLASPKKVDEISDKSKIVKKGFDIVKSFRNMK